uniref:Tektin n=1 Tax=Eptatretus burgeri TaxID=7764 RepID=A0A8C4QFM3_EPTBU
MYPLLGNVRCSQADMEARRMLPGPKNSMGTNEPPRCSETSWHGAWAAGGQSCIQSRWLRDRAEQLVQETLEITGARRAESEHRLQERECSLYYWRQEFISRGSSLEEEAKQLLNSQLRVQHAQRTCTHPLDVVQQCIEHRAALGGHEAGKKVHSELKRQLETIKTAQDVLHDLEEKLTEQIRCNRAMSRSLDRDLSGKMAALELETQAYNMVLQDSELGQMKQLRENGGRAEGPVNVAEKGGPSLEQWISLCRMHLTGADKELHSSAKLLSMVDQQLMKISADLAKQWLTVKEAFNWRIDEIRHAKGMLEDRVAQVVEEQEACERTITKLIQAKETLQAPLCLVEVRNICISDDARIALHREQQQLMHNKERSNSLKAQTRERRVKGNRQRVEPKNAVPKNW